jgi:hypothetical protein
VTEPRTKESGINLFSKCFGCGREFKRGDSRLRFSLDEFADYRGLGELGIDIDIGLCDDCTEKGDFKTPEIVDA